MGFAAGRFGESVGSLLEQSWEMAEGNFVVKYSGRG